MGEAIIRKKFGKQIFVDSAGIRSGVADPFVTAVLNEQGMDRAHHQPKSLEDLDDSWFDLVIAFSEEAYETVQNTNFLDYSKLLFWPAGDPTTVQGSREQVLDAYRLVRNQIADRIEKHFMPTPNENSE